jgi:glycosyltransferase involved in cell wall biosynthesis
VDADDVLRLRTRNAPLLLEMAACDAAITATRFQHAQFPAMAADRLTVLHDGVDTDFFSPDPSSRFSLPGLPDEAELVTYATRGMEPYRGFPQFMRALVRLQERRPAMHAVIAAEDRVIYGRRLPEGESWRRRMLAELPELDLSRIHFTGHLSYERYRALLRRSDAHVYLTVPFVLSWSAIEALSTGCLMIGSDTAPLREIIEPGSNGLLADFHDAHDLAARIEEALDMESEAKQRMRKAARATARARYSLKDLLPRQLALLRG